jgi:hypothetical protein
VWVQRRGGSAGRWHVGPLLGLNQRDHSRRHAGVGYQQGTGIGATSCQPKYSLCWCRQRQGWSCQCRDGTAQCQDWGVLDSEADRPKVIFLQKKEGLNLIRRKGCYLAA